MRKPKLHWVLLSVLLVALAGAYYILEQREEEPPAAPTTAARIPLVEVERDDVAEIQVERGDDRLVLLPHNDSWLVEQYPDEEFDPQLLERAAQGLLSLEANQVVEESPSDVERFGLENPKITARAILEDGSMVSVRIGDRLVAAYLDYVQVEGDPAVYVASAMYGERLSVAPIQLRTRHLGTLHLPDLTYLKFPTADGRTVEIKPNPDMSPYLHNMDRLLLVQPFDTPHRIASYSLMFESTQMEMYESPDYIFNAREFIVNPEALETYGLAPDSPERREVILADAEYELHFVLGRKRDERDYYAKLAGTDDVFAIHSNHFFFMDSEPIQWVNKLAHIVNIEQVAEVQLNWEDERYTMEIERVEVTNEEGETVIEERFLLNGKEAPERLFRTLYRTVIMLSFDAEIDRVPEAEPNFSVSMLLKDTEEWVRTEYIPYSRDLYAVKIGGVTEFVTSLPKVEYAKNALDDLIEAVDGVEGID